MIELVEGWSDAIPYEITRNGAGRNLTGTTVTMDVLDRNGNPKTFTGSFVVTNAALGLVAFTPSAGDLLSAEAPYRIRFKVIESGKTSYHPKDQREVWRVSK